MDRLERAVEQYDLKQAHGERLPPRIKIERRVCRKCWLLLPSRDARYDIIECPSCRGVLDEVTT